MGNPPVNGKLLPIFLAVICLIPLVFGMTRMFEIAAAGQFALEFLDDYVDRIPLFLHIFGSLAFLVFGALQILPGTRARFPRFHRRSGRVIVPLGLLGALTGIWMTLLHPDISGPLLYWGRLLSASFWAVAIVAGLRAMRQRDYARHGAWMTRAYAISLPAGTLALILLPMVLILGEEGHDFLFEIVQVLAWPLHLGIAEWIICQRRKERARKQPQPPALAGLTINLPDARI